MVRVGLAIRLGAFLGAAALASSALGATVAFDFRGATLPAANTWTSGGVSVTATAQSQFAFQTGFPYLTDDANKGLGVVSVKTFLLPNDPLINTGESIQLTFAPTITVNSITFTELQDFVGFGDYVTLSYTDPSGTAHSLKSVQGEGSGPYDTYTYSLPSPVTATTFTVGADSFRLNSFGLAGISVDYSAVSAANDPVAVGLPASVWQGASLLSVLGGLILWRRNAPKRLVTPVLS